MVRFLSEYWPLAGLKTSFVESACDRLLNCLESVSYSARARGFPTEGAFT